MCRTLEEDKLPLKAFKKTVVYAVQALTEGGLHPDESDILRESKVAQSAFLGNCIILRSAVRSDIEVKTFSRDVKVMMPDEFASVLVSAYRNRKEVLQDKMTEESQQLALPSLESIRWRVDVTISTTSLSRVFRPTVTFSITLSNGKVRTFEVSMEKFNELRYNVAKLLKLTLDLEKHPMLVRDL